MKFFRVLSIVAMWMYVSNVYANAPIVTKAIDRTWAPNWTSVVGVWHFDELRTAIAAGGTDFQDASGKGNNAVRKGGVILAKTGRLGNALALDGQPGTYISMGTAPSLSPLGQQNFTVSLWFNGQNFQHSPLVSRGGGGAAQGLFECYLDGDNADPQLAKEIACSFKNTAGVEIGSVSNVRVRPTRNAWHQFALTRADTVLTLFLDGQAVGTGSINGLQVTLADFRVGGSANAPGFAGLVDELGLWNSALRSEQIYSNYLHQAGLLADHGYPLSAYYYPRTDFLADPTSFQRVLDTYKVIRLDPGANYQLFGQYLPVTQGTAPNLITLGSGYKIFGMKASIVPPILIKAGSSEVVLSNLHTGPVTFEATSANVSTHDNLFMNIGPASPVATGANLENNLFIRSPGVKFDDSASGYLRNNRFISNVGGSFNPLVTLKGNTTTPSYSNIMILQNGTAPAGDFAYFSGLDDLIMITPNSEAWNSQNQSINGAAITVDSSVKTMRLFDTSGGNSGFNSNTTNFVGFLKTGSPVSILIHAFAASWKNPTIELGSTVDTAIILGGLSLTNNPDVVSRPGQSDFKAYSNFSVAVDPGNTDAFNFVSTIKQNGTNTNLIDTYGPDLTTLTPDNLASMRSAMITNGGNPLSGKAWDKPNYTSPPDPAGPNWNVNLAAQPDSTTYIQNLIDSSTMGYAALPPGKYYISASLRIDRTHGLVGSGADQTVIIAKDPSIDMIVPAHNGSTASYPFIVTDLTLQGGANGFHLTSSVPFTNYGIVYNVPTFQHVALRNMSHAGIFLDQASIDTVTFDHIYYINNAAGFIHIVDPGNHSYVNGLSCYRCQYISNTGLAIDLIQIAYENLFQNNGSAMAYNGTNAPNGSVINSDFINNGGYGMASMGGRLGVMQTNGYPASILGSRISAGPRAPSAALSGLLAGPWTVVDSTFTLGGAATTTSIMNPNLYPNRNIMSFYNNSAPDMALGSAPISGYLYNNYFPKSPNSSYEGVMMQLGNPTPILTNRVTAPPVPQYIIGSPMQYQY